MPENEGALVGRAGSEPWWGAVRISHIRAGMLEIWRNELRREVDGGLDSPRRDC
jgi:hypothetical protein